MKDCLIAKRIRVCVLPLPIINFDDYPQQKKPADDYTYKYTYVCMLVKEKGIGSRGC
jgi:hypothetical protein